MERYIKFSHKVIELPDLIDHYGRVEDIQRVGELLVIKFKWILNITEKQIVLQKGPFIREYTFGIPLQYFLTGRSEMKRMIENQFDKFDKFDYYI